MNLKIIPRFCESEIKCFFCQDGIFAVNYKNKLYVIELSGDILPDFEINGYSIMNLLISKFKIFIITQRSELLIADLRDKSIENLGVLGKNYKALPMFPHSIGMYYNTKSEIKILKDISNNSVDDVVLSMDTEIIDFYKFYSLYCVLTKNDVYIISMKNKKKREMKMFNSLGFYKIFGNDLGWIVLENPFYFVILYKFRFIKAVDKPSPFYKIIITDYFLILLSYKVFIHSLITGNVEYTISLTAFDGCYDFKLKILWLYSISFYEIYLVNYNNDVIKDLIMTDNYNMALKLCQSPAKRANIYNLYAKYLFRKNNFRKSIKMYGKGSISYKFNRLEILEMIKNKKERAFNIMFEDGTLASININMLIKFLWMKVVRQNIDYDYLFYILYLKSRYKRLKMLINLLRNRNLKVSYIRKTNITRIDLKRKKIFLYYYKLMEPATYINYLLNKNKVKKIIYYLQYLILEKNMNEENLAKKILFLILSIKSMAIVKLLYPSQRSYLLEYMYKHNNYINLEYYLSIAEDLFEDLQTIFRILWFINIEKFSKIQYELANRVLDDPTYFIHFNLFLSIKTFIIESRSSFMN
ncbi:hypothetical protein TCON_2041 [Astathelohania contejeani]|uniref:Uncharacterized protein n=1 Tax=Astathelohania contejeani TaxID=164912 RepID=A0ABQ7HX54_9MICR|nr:hypothetical protein TCON_2041 [Thelohania contejeani]